MLNILINGVHCSEYGLTPLRGCLGELMKPAKPKAPIVNTNKAINGDVVALYHGQVQSRTVTLFFLIKGFGGVEQLQEALDRLTAALQQGEDGKGTNRLFVEELNRHYYLFYEEMSEYNAIGESDRAILRIKFLEPNPTNHAE